STITLRFYHTFYFPAWDFIYRFNECINYQNTSIKYISFGIRFNANGNKVISEIIKSKTNEALPLLSDAFRRPNK
ncbi:hypothetical protein, partial [Cronobacter malonaticus]|uniref:hypothetical protein n=1 Tax=Cronobacter malonaticus TaxID=413503 RepID=UPI001F2BA55C